MGLQALFQNAARTAFNAFGDIVKEGVYTHVVDDGFTKTETDYDVDVIPVSSLEEEQNTINFREIIQPNDIIVLIPGIDLTVDMTINSKLTLTPPDSETEKTMKIVDKNVDAAKALYILLLRKA